MKHRLSISLFAAVCFSCGFFTADAARGLEIEETVWGYDGQAVPQRFNLLSVLVSNPSKEPFDGGIALHKDMTGAHDVGAPLEQPLFLSPYSQKWVQFHPFVGGFTQWRLEWGEGHDSRKWGREADQRGPVSMPRLGKPAYVLINPVDALLPPSRGAGLKGLPENLFPSIVTATDGLAGVVLDHNPRWQEPQRTAFRDWLYAGGQVHVLHDSDGNFPDFSAPLEMLNTPLPTMPVGQGTVYRHPLRRAELTADFVKGNITQRLPAQNELEREIKINYGTPKLPEEETITWSFEELAFPQLSELTRADHNWALIYLMSVIYLLAIGPGGYLLGRRRIDYRVVIAALLGTITFFSLLFAVIGARGYDEATVVDSVAVARPLPDGRFDVAGWSNAFVTNGGVYTMAHPGQGRLYSTCQAIERVNGVINEDPGGRFFAVDIPPYSSRSFAHRVKAAGPTPGFHLNTFGGGAKLDLFDLTIDPEWKSRIHGGYVLYDDDVYRLNFQGNRLVLDHRGLPLTRLLRGEHFEAYNNFGYKQHAYDDTQDLQEAKLQMTYAALTRPLIMWSMKFPDQSTAARFRLPRDRARLFLEADLPPEFQLPNDQFPRQTGRVIYCLDVMKPSTATGKNSP